jgi:hypothetical protein
LLWEILLLVVVAFIEEVYLLDLDLAVFRGN